MEQGWQWFKPQLPRDCIACVNSQANQYFAWNQALGRWHVVDPQAGTIVRCHLIITLQIIQFFLLILMVREFPQLLCLKNILEKIWKKMEMRNTWKNTKDLNILLSNKKHGKNMGFPRRRKFYGKLDYIFKNKEKKMKTKIGLSIV